MQKQQLCAGGVVGENMKGGIYETDNSWPQNKLLPALGRALFHLLLQLPGFLPLVNDNVWHTYDKAGEGTGIGKKLWEYTPGNNTYTWEGIFCNKHK